MRTWRFLGSLAGQFQQTALDDSCLASVLKTPELTGTIHADPASPEGVAADATVHWGAGPPESPDVIINVSADNTAAFSAWAMGTGASRCSIGDLTGALLLSILSLQCM